MKTEFKPDWDWAKKWQESKKEEAEDKEETIFWSWDCSFKLDYDGDILSVSSRFYPPFKTNGNGWDGDVTFYSFNKEILRKTFNEPTLELLTEKVELFVKDQRQKVLKNISQLFPEWK